jgi:hypothetical protein
VRAGWAWRWGETVAPGCIELCDWAVTEALSTGKRFVPDKHRHGQPVASGNRASLPCLEARLQGRL